MTSETDVQAQDNIARAIRESMLAWLMANSGRPDSAIELLQEKLKENE